MHNYIITAFFALSLFVIFAPADAAWTTDLIDQSSTASHIDASQWQERNPQHTVPDSSAEKKCLCRLPGGRSYKCSCSDPKAVSAEAVKNGASVSGRASMGTRKQQSPGFKIYKEETVKEDSKDDTKDDKLADSLGQAFVGAVIGHGLNSSGTHKKNKKKSGKKYISKNTSSSSSSSAGTCSGCAAVGCPDYKIENGSCVCLCDDKVSVY